MSMLFLLFLSILSYMVMHICRNHILQNRGRRFRLKNMSDFLHILSWVMAFVSVILFIHFLSSFLICLYNYDLLLFILVSAGFMLYVILLV